MASGGEIVRPKEPIITRAASGKGKAVDYKQMLSGSFKESGLEFESESQSDGPSDSGLYQDLPSSSKQPEVDAFIAMGHSTGKPPLMLPRGDLDFQLAAEEEELSILRMQLEAAKKEEVLLKKRSEADTLRRQIAEQQKSNGKLRGMPNDTQSVNKVESSEKQSKSQEILDNTHIDINTLRKSKQLRKSVNKKLKKLGLVDDISSDTSHDTSSNKSISLKGRSDSESVVRKKEKKISSKTSDGTSESDLSVTYESSDSSSSDNRRKRKKNKKKKSGIKAKASDTVHFPQKYPQAYLRYEFTSSNISFDKLDFNLFIAGELEIISSKKIKEVERSGRLNLLKKIMYLNTSYDFKTLKAFYAACLNEIEIGLKKWDDDFQQIESAVLSKHVPKQKSQFVKKSGFKGKEDSENKKSSDDKLWFCSSYQRNKCPQKLSHTETKYGRMHFAQHVCATCWQKDAKKLEHPECSSACPYAKM